MSNITVNISSRASLNIFTNNFNFVEVKEIGSDIFLLPIEKKDYVEGKFYAISRKQGNCTKFGITTDKLKPKTYYVFEKHQNGWFQMVEIDYESIDKNTNYASTFESEEDEYERRPFSSFKIEMNTYTRINFINPKIKSFEVKNDKGIFMIKPSKEESNDNNGRIITKKHFTAISNCLKTDTFYEVSKVRGGWLVCKETNDNKGKNIIHVIAA